MIRTILTATEGPGGNPYVAALRGLRPVVLLVVVASAFVNVLMLTSPLFMLQVYDRVLASASVPTLVGLFGVVVILFLFLGVFDFLRLRLLSRAGYRLDREVAGQGFDIWLRSAVAGNAASHRPLHDLAVVRSHFGSPAMLGFFDLPYVPVYLVIAFAIHPWLGAVTLAGAAITTALALLGQALTSRSYGAAMASDASESFFVEQGYRNAETVLALGMADRLGARWRRMHDDGLAAGQDGGDHSEVLSTISKVFRIFLQSAILAFAAWLVLRQELSPGMIIAASTIAGKALAPIDQVIGQWRAVVRAREAHLRLCETMQGQGAEDPAAVDLPEPEGRLLVQDLTKLAPGARSGGRRLPVLNQVSFALDPGDALGVIGPSASGKSTLAKCLVGAWTPDGGEVRLDSATPAQWGPAARARHVGYLPQTVELLTGTIRDNIARFDTQAQDRDIVAAARLAGVHEMILQLPEGYGTRLGHGGLLLSGGQTQRIGLARAVYGRPRLVVLDEPNSNLDAAGDEALAEAIGALRAGGTTLVIMAHRPSAIAAVNKLLVLQNGTVAHFGDKDAVLALATRPVPGPAPTQGSHVRSA
jgi:PrtD family type I secretion system ABC transporter